MTSATPDRAATGRRLGYLDGLRAIASLFVLVHHTFAMAYPISLGVTAHGVVGVVFGWAVFGHFGVTIFIVLAGYSLALGIAGRGGELPGRTIGFMQRRAWRIIPPYWAALAATIVLQLTLIGASQGTHWDLSVPPYHKGWLADALLFQDVFAPGQDAAYTFWSIAVEWHIYLLLPVMLLVRRWTRSWFLAIGFGTAGSLVVLLAARLHEPLGNLHPEYYVLFALAVGACVAVRLRPMSLTRLPLMAMAGIGFAIVTAVCITHPYSWVQANFDWMDILLGLSVLCIVTHVSLRERSRTSRALAVAPLVRVGLFSYSIYLVHAPLLALAWKYVIQPMDVSRATQLAIGWLAVLPMIVVIAYGFYLLVEKPFVGRRPRRLRDASVGAVSTKAD